MNNEDGISHLTGLLEEYQSQRGKINRKYAVVRVPNEKCSTILKKKINDELDDISVIDTHYRYGDESDLNQIVSTVPDKFTVIVIYDRLRAGVQLDTSNISFVYEQKSSNSSACDTVAQGLVGRCCGHNKEKNRHAVKAGVLNGFRNKLRAGARPSAKTKRSRRVRRCRRPCTFMRRT